MPSSTQLGSDPVVSVTTDREAHPKRWIAALVQSCLEKKVGERLDKLGVENYIPTQTVIRQWSDRKKKIERVVIPMIVFIRTDEMTERRLRMQTYIRKILSYPGQWEAAVIPDAQIDRLKFMLRHAESSVELLEQTLQVGEAIRVARGPLKGLDLWPQHIWSHTQGLHRTLGRCSHSSQPAVHSACPTGTQSSTATSPGGHWEGGALLQGGYTLITTNCTWKDMSCGVRGT